MAKWLNSIGELLKDGKKRVVIILMAIIVLVALIIGILHLVDNNRNTQGQAQLASVPSNIQSVPGADNQQNQQYLQALLASNQQAAQSALKSGQSEIPTLISSPNASTGTNLAAQSAPVGSTTTSPCCCQQCVNPNDPGGKIAALEAAGKLSPLLAGQLKQLQVEGVTPDQYAAQLSQLVQAGQITPAVAKELADSYNQAQSSAQGTGGSTAPNDLANQLADEGAISAATAQTLQGLNNQGLKPGDYAKQLAQLVQAGNLTPAQAQQLLAAYKKSYSAQASPDGLTQQLAQSGAISPETAAQLQALNDEGLSPDSYAAALQKLVKEGKLTPDEAQALLNAYRQQSAGLGPGASGSLADLEKAQAEAQQQAEQQAAQAQEQANQQVSTLQQTATAQTQTLASEIASQAQQLITAWAAPRQQLVGAISDQAAGSSANGSNAGGGNSSSTQSVGNIIRAGDIMFAVLNTAVNSDQPGPILATLVTGKFKGSKLLGNLQITPDHEAVVLSFNTLTNPNWPQSISISAVAVNPDTARTALASNVDHHYLLRFSSLFAASFLQGIGSAVQNSGNTQTNNSGTTTQTFSNLNTGSKILVGLGQVGQAMGSAAQAEFSTSPTITVNSGTGMGILFQNDVPAPSFLSTANNTTQSTGA
ncbi:MAG: hypothetical protein A3E87_02335 [Gammaproteobacteria bacterium RIFCSPHIGHO2_12_FULL_35_23]|nr:MAG: hypothetical protein A3E87_02335 [Gammaproteobacteria bacterium RIFCSPHIGHO2_12_FULL_35_23]